MLNARKLADRIDLANGAKTCIFQPGRSFLYPQLSLLAENKALVAISIFGYAGKTNNAFDCTVLKDV
jgi:hypothetical protein